MALRSFRVSGGLLILTIVVFLTGCAHKGKVEPPPGTFLEDVYTTANTSPDVDKFTQTMPSYIRYLEGLVLAKPLDLQLVFRTSGAYYGYTYCGVEDTDKKEASSLYLKGRDYSLNELKRYRIFDQAFDKPIPEFRQALIDSLDKRNIQALYWAAINWLGWINLNLDTPEARADMPKVQALLEFVNTLDESYNNGSVHAALGALYANRPKADGGDPEKAKAQFEKAFIISGNSLMTYHVMYAQFYARQIKDRELFQQTLKTVVETPANYYQEKTFMNEVARRKAKLLLDDIDKYFKPAETKKTPEAEASPEQAQPATQEFKKTVFYPYTIHISSLQNPKNVVSQYEKKYRNLEMVFVTKIDLGQTGIWYRIDYGAFPSIQEAILEMKELQAKNIIDQDTFIGSAAPYTIEIGVYPDKDGASAQAQRLREKGMIPYILEEPGGVYRLLSGAYPDEKSADPAREDLKALGLQPKVTKR